MQDEYLQRLHRFQVSFYEPTTPPAGGTEGTYSPQQDEIAARLGAVDPALAASYRQVLLDIASLRETYVGPAAEIREVLRGAVARLAPDAAVIAQQWFLGHEGRPTHAERTRYALQQNRGVVDDQILKADDILETKIGRLSRSLYERTSKALHAGTQRREAAKIVHWVEVLLDEVLPGP